MFAGLAFIPQTGIQGDEALFSAPIYFGTPESDHVTVFGLKLHLMVMTYVGTLKSAFYALLFDRWRPGPWSVRVPVLVAGMATVWLFFRLLSRIAGPRAGVAGAALLATDAAFLLTTVYDWGPVALQHLLVTAAALLVLRFAQDQSRWRLAAGFFLMGLAMWDKAIAIWTLAALAVALALVFPRELWQRITVRNAGIAATAFVAGALPLIAYNVVNPLKTFKGNAQFSTEHFEEKARLVRLTLEGSSLFGYVAREGWEKPLREPGTELERASVSVRDALGEHRAGLGLWAFGAALVLAPRWWHRRRPVLFALTFCLVAWLQMAFTKDAGGGVHHVILLWPFPLMAVAVAFAAASERLAYGRAVLTAVVAIVAVSNVLVTNQYFVQLVRNGTTVIWSDAVTPLAKSLGRYRAKHVFAMDWGIREVVYMLHRGQLTLWNGEDAVTPVTNTAQVRRMLALDSVYVTHAGGAELNAGGGGRFRAAAAELGYRETVLETVPDRNGRPVFQISEFRLPR